MATEGETVLEVFGASENERTGGELEYTQSLCMIRHDIRSCQRTRRRDMERSKTKVSFPSTAPTEFWDDIADRFRLVEGGRWKNKNDV